MKSFAVETHMQLKDQAVFTSNNFKNLAATACLFVPMQTAPDTSDWTITLDTSSVEPPILLPFQQDHSLLGAHVPLHSVSNLRHF